MAHAESQQIVLWNPAAERMFGYRASEALGLRVEALVPERLKGRHRAGIARYAETGHGPFIDSDTPLELPAVTKNGEEISIELSLSPLDKTGEDVGGERLVLAIIRDITERKRAEREIGQLSRDLENQVAERTAELRTRAHQRAAIAWLGQRALTQADLPGLMEEAVDLLSENLGVEYAKVLELLPEGDALLLRAGVGWREGLVGAATVEADRDSQAGYTLLADRAVVVEDLGEETRFKGPPLLRDHGVVSGMSVIIEGVERPFGVLGAHARERRTFTENDVNFLRAVANVLAAAIERNRAERVFRSTFEQAAVGIAHTAPEGWWLRVNQKLCDMLGYTLEELHQRTFEDLTHPDDLEANREHVNRLLGGEVDTFSMEKRYVRKDGSLLWANLTASLVRDDRGEPEYFIAVVEDIDSRKRAEEALKESQERYKVLYEHNPTMYLTADTEGTILSVNEFGAQQLGYAPQELIGRTMSGLLYKEDKDLGLHHIKECVSYPSRVTHGEFRKVRKDGSVLWVRETARAMPMPADDLLVLVVCEDVSDEKAVQEALEEQAKLLDLTHDVIMVRDMAGKIQFWNRGAEETFGWDREEALGKDACMLLKTRFPQQREQIEAELLRSDTWEGELEHQRRDGSHVITSSRWALRRGGGGRPLAVLETNNDITERKRAQQAAYEIREAERRRIARDLHDIVLQDLVSALQALQYLSAQRSTETEHGVDLSQEISALRRAASGLGSAIHELRMDKEQPLLGGVESLAELNRQMTPERRIEVAVGEEFPQQLPDKLRVELLRAIQEALTNARRHSEARRVRVGLWMEGGELCTEIADDGRGFDPESVLRGVGLSGMHERIEALGGELEIRSRPGEGTRVISRVPLKAVEDDTPDR